MIEKLKEFFEYNIKLMQWTDSENDRKIYYHRVFGVVEFVYDNANLQEKEDIRKLWDEWKEILEIEVYR